MLSRLFSWLKFLKSTKFPNSIWREQKNNFENKVWSYVLLWVKLVKKHSLWRNKDRYKLWTKLLIGHFIINENTWSNPNLFFVLDGSGDQSMISMKLILDDDDTMLLYTWYTWLVKSCVWILIVRWLSWWCSFVSIPDSDGYYYYYNDDDYNNYNDYEYDNDNENGDG